MPDQETQVLDDKTVIVRLNLKSNNLMNSSTSTDNLEENTGALTLSKTN